MLTNTVLTEAEVDKWLTGLSAFDNDNRTILFCIFAAFGVPASMLDVGSGTGAMINTAEKLGVDVNGLDQLPRPAHPKLIQHDLRNPIDLGRKFELVTSIETAEHLEAEYAETFVDTIVKHASKRIIFTAAMPGQIGDGHLNCQPAVYWREKFYKRHWDFSAPETHRLAALLALAFHASHHVEANLQVFLK